MDRPQPDPAPAEPTSRPTPALDRAYWERIAEESLARVFLATDSDLLLRGSEADAGVAGALMDDSDARASGQDPSLCRQGFRLALTGRGTSFTPIIGACFHFQSLRRLTAASGRQLGLKSVIVVRGQVVLLPDSNHANGPSGLGWPPDRSRARLNSRRGITTLPQPTPPPERTLLGLAELMPLPLERSDTVPRGVAPAHLPLWGR